MAVQCALNRHMFAFRPGKMAFREKVGEWKSSMLKGASRIAQDKQSPQAVVVLTCWFYIWGAREDFSV